MFPACHVDTGDIGFPHQGNDNGEVQGNGRVDDQRGQRHMET